MRRLITKFISIFHPYDRVDRAGREKYFMMKNDSLHCIYNNSGKCFNPSLTWIGCWIDLCILNLFRK